MTDTSTDQSDAGTSDEILEELQAWLDQNWDPELTVGEWWERLGLSGWAAPGLPTHAYGKGLIPVLQMTSLALLLTGLGLGVGLAL